MGFVSKVVTFIK